MSYSKVETDAKEQLARDEYVAHLKWVLQLAENGVDSVVGQYQLTADDIDTMLTSFRLKQTKKAAEERTQGQHDLFEKMGMSDLEQTIPNLVAMVRSRFAFGLDIKTGMRPLDCLDDAEPQDP